MLEFKKAGIEDIPELKKALEGYKHHICDFSAGNIVFWRDYYDITYYYGKEGFMLHFGKMNGVSSYSYPLGENPGILIDTVLSESKEPVWISCLTAEQCRSMHEHFDCISCHHSCDWDDYLYSSEDIVTLRGRKFNGQRNHINKFRRLYTDSVFEEITSENVGEAADFCHRFFHGMSEPTNVSAYEEKQLAEQLTPGNWDRYMQLGGILRVGDKVVGLSVGEIVGQTLIIHTEKADTSYEGAYPMLTNSYASHFAGNCIYINREEDCGDAGLRTSKSSYHPLRMVEKYALLIKNR